jgi:hypothetical protein
MSRQSPGGTGLAVLDCGAADGGDDALVSPFGAGRSHPLMLNAAAPAMTIPAMRFIISPQDAEDVLCCVRYTE